MHMWTNIYVYTHAMTIMTSTHDLQQWLPEGYVMMCLCAGWQKVPPKNCDCLAQKYHWDMLGIDSLMVTHASMGYCAHMLEKFV